MLKHVMYTIKGAAFLGVVPCIILLLVWVIPEYALYVLCGFVFLLASWIFGQLISHNPTGIRR
jgi:hypothetical protein